MFVQDVCTVTIRLATLAASLNANDAEKNTSIHSMKFASYPVVHAMTVALRSMFPGDITEEGKARYYEMYREQFEAPLRTAVLDDMEELFQATPFMTWHCITLEDDGAQGRSHVVFRVAFRENPMPFEVRLECGLFEEVIIIQFEYPEILEMLSKHQQSILKSFVFPKHNINSGSLFHLEQFVSGK
jgi:hypothetical protein